MEIGTLTWNRELWRMWQNMKGRVLQQPEGHQELSPIDQRSGLPRHSRMNLKWKIFKLRKLRCRRLVTFSYLWSCRGRTKWQESRKLPLGTLWKLQWIRWRECRKILLFPEWVCWQQWRRKEPTRRSHHQEPPTQHPSLPYQRHHL